MPMHSVICEACRREHRWREEMAGTEFLCHCGEWVYCPAPGDSGYIDEVPKLSKSEAITRENEFEVDHGFDGASSSGSGTVAQVRADDLEGFESEACEVEFTEAGVVPGPEIKRARIKGKKVRAISPSRGLLGLGPFTELCVWIAASMLGFTLAMMAAFNPSRLVYVILAVLIAPVSWFMLRRSYMVWKRGRRFVIAVDDQLSKDAQRTA